MFNMFWHLKCKPFPASVLNNQHVSIKNLDEIVGEPKSRIVQKHTFFAPERYTAGILYTDSLNSAGYETTV